jgi:hypothetical protein
VNVTVDPLLLASSNIQCYEPQFLGAPKLVCGSNLIIETFKGTPTVSTTVYSTWTEEGNNAPGLYEVGPLHQFKVILNGQDRFKEQYGRYFNQVQPFYHHSGNPYPGIYTYSFALQPEEHQPTGTCNFSRIDNAQVYVALKATSLSTIQKMFAVNYNILRIQSGMGGLAFSN